MRKASLPNLTIPALLLADGLICVVTAVFAHTIGLDPDITWGRFRTILFFSGILLILICLPFLFPKRPNLPFVNTIQKAENLKTVFLLGHLWAVIFVIYAWFITFGNFTTWRNTTRYYTQLADAFRNGQLHVDADPGEALLAAEDPYSTTSRPAFNDEIWDMSLYKGKLYLYWGPVPALLITPIQFITNAKITDMYLVYFFYCGLLVFNSLIILKLWRLFFANIPIWNVILSIFVIGFILPVLWSLNRPEVYQAAIGAGQFFLMGGIYFIVSAFEDGSTIKKGSLFWAGLFWVCSVGSRAMNVLPIVFMVLLIMLWILKSNAKPIKWTKYVQTLTALFIPLVAGAFAIGWYNWARFDSPFEFGLRYQITIHNLNQLMGQTFQADYFLPNLYVYVFQPFEFISKFPFIQPITIAGFFEKINMTAPKIYFSGRMTGFLIYGPFLALALLPFFSKTMSTINKDHTSPEPQLILFMYLLAASFTVNFISLLFFFFGQLRYSVDIISQLTLLAILGYWGIVCLYKSKKCLWSKIFVHLAHLLLVITIAASILLAFSSETNRMEKLNPLLMEKLDSFFTLKK